MPPSIFPLRWESTGDQWWYASPIDWAAANGLYDVVLELLHQDANLLIKLTSLRRIRRLETLWDDDDCGDGSNFHGVARCRSHVARKLLHECESNDGRNYNSLIRAGYGGWLLYTAASAGDSVFVKELLERDPLLVFGEGEYGVTDILYAATRGKNPEVFKMLLDFSLLPAGISSEKEEEDKLSEKQIVVKEEMMNRAVHCAARGGNVEMLKELIGDCGEDVLGYRDAEGSTILHSASGRGQFEVVKHLIASYDTITASKDNQGNTALHVAAYKGHLAVVESLILSSPSLISITNNHGDTFLHMTVAGFKTLGFRRLDQQIELMKQLVSGNILSLQDIINARNNDGKTALHTAVMDNTIQYDIVELLLKIPSIDLNVHDSDGMTPLDLLKRQPRSASSEILIKRLVSVGGGSKGQDDTARSTIVSDTREHGFCGSPGTSFRVSDSEIFVYGGLEENAPEASPDKQSCDNISVCSSEVSEYLTSCSLGGDKKVKYAARRLKFLLRWTKRKEKVKNDFSGKLSTSKNWEDRQIPLRDVYSSSPSLKQIERTFSIKSTGDLPSPSTRRKFTEGLMQGVIFRSTPRFIFSPFSNFSQDSKCSSPVSSEKHKEVNVSELDRSQASSLNKKFVNRYFCFGAQGLAIEDSAKCSRPVMSLKRVTSLVS